jgi:hypothetical protein
MTDVEIVVRLEQLERENRRLKRVGIAALLAIASIMLLAAAPPVPQKLTAHEFEVLDSSGRATVSINDRMVNILDPQSGLPRIAIGDVTPGVAGIWLFEGNGSRTVELPAGDGSEIAFFDTGGRPRATIGLASGNPTIRLSDPQGFEMDLGNTSTATPTTGATEQSSAASIVMFGGDKEHHVVWRAP